MYQNCMRKTPESDYSLLLAPYSFSFILKQLSLASSVKKITTSDDIHTIDTSEGPKTVSPLSCECIFFTSMKLPCRHIFALRQKLELPLFDPDICDKRWTSEYYRATQRIFFTSPPTPSVSVTCSECKKPRKVSQHEKFRKANLLTTELATVMSEASHIHFNQRLDLVKDLIRHWKSGNEVGLMDVDDGMCSKCTF